MARHAQRETPPRSSMSRQLIVTVITARSLDLVVNMTDLRAAGNEVINRAGIVCGQVKHRQGARSVNPDRMRGRRVEPGRRLGMKYILVLTRPQRRHRSARI